MLDYLKIYSKTIVTIFLVVLTLGAIFYFVYRHISEKEEQLQQAVTMTQEQSLDAAYLKRKLEISEQNAIELQKQIKLAQDGIKKPVVTFSQAAESVESATTIVQERINSGDATLPSQALEKTDRTEVVAQPDSEYQVGVYKTNLYKDWYRGVGIGIHNSDIYIPVSVQRNYSKDRAVNAQVNLDPSNNFKVKGAQIVYMQATNKLLWIF